MMNNELNVKKILYFCKMKKLKILLILLLIVGCNKTDKIDEVETQDTLATVEQQPLTEEEKEWNTRVAKYAHIHNNTYTYSLTNDTLYFVNSINDTFAIGRIFLDSVCLDRDSVWVPCMSGYSYDGGFSFIQFARLLFGYVNLLDSIGYFKMYEKYTFLTSYRNMIPFKYAGGWEYTYIKYATHQEYYDDKRHSYRDDVMEPSQFNAWLLRMKLGEKYFEMCDRVEKLGIELLELSMNSCYSCWGTGMITVLGTSIEESLISLYIAVNEGYDVLRKPSKNFQNRKNRFIRELTNNSRKELFRTLKEHGGSTESFDSYWKYCESSISKISELINNDFLLEFAKNRI